MNGLNCGTFSHIEKEGNILKKIIAFDSLRPHQNNVLKNTQKANDDLLKYQNLLLKHNIPFEKIFNFSANENTICFNQRYINSPNIDILLYNLGKEFNKNKDTILKIFEDIISIWSKSHKTNEIFVDFNLRNFVYDGDTLTLIDLFPPIIRKNINFDVKDNFSKRLIILWTNKYINLTSMFCYFLVPIIEENYSNLRNIIQFLFHKMFDIIHKKTNITFIDLFNEQSKLNEPCCKRFQILLKFVNNEINQNDFIKLYMDKQVII